MDLVWRIDERIRNDRWVTFDDLEFDFQTVSREPLFNNCSRSFSISQIVYSMSSQNIDTRQ